jgi:hypothetical protein
MSKLVIEHVRQNNRPNPKMPSNSLFVRRRSRSIANNNGRLWIETSGEVADLLHFHLLQLVLLAVNGAGDFLGSEFIS